MAIRRFSSRKEEDRGAPEERAAPVRPARETWNVVLETMPMHKGVIYGLYFHHRGTAIYYLYRHCQKKEEAEKEYERLTKDLALGQTEFEIKYDLKL